MLGAQTPLEQTAQADKKMRMGGFRTLTLPMRYAFCIPCCCGVIVLFWLHFYRGRSGDVIHTEPDLLCTVLHCSAGKETR